MKTKETKINIEVNIYGTRFTVTAPFSRQDAVRATEAEMKATFTRLKERHPMKTTAECLAMMAYEYASNYFTLSAQQEAAASEAEELLRDAARLCGGEGDDVPETNREEYGEF